MKIQPWLLDEEGTAPHPEPDTKELHLVFQWGLQVLESEDNGWL
jgi:hypothetical protein